MSQNSNIEWTDHTFNTHWGCSKISPGCDGCYAEALAKRFGYGWGDDAPKREFGEDHWNDLIRWDRKAAADGVRRRVFTNSMSDLFDKFAPAGVRERHWQFVQRTPNLDHLLLTKRIGNVRGMVPATWLKPGGWPEHVRIGITIVNQTEAARDIPKLLALGCPNLLSMEPLLGAVNLRSIPANLSTIGGVDDKYDWFDALTGTGITPNGPQDADETAAYPHLDWVIVGGESGPGARPMHPDWARDLRDQCTEAGVPFLFKQWGEWAPGENCGAPMKRTERTADWWDDKWWFDTMTPSASVGMHADDEPTLYRCGKKNAGRHLDGRTHDEFPGSAL